MADQLVSKLVNTNLDFIATEILPKIEIDFARTSAIEVLERLKQTVAALTDDQPNKEQLELIWGTLTSDPEMVEAMRSALLKAISNIDDENLKLGLGLLIQPITKTLVAVTDNVKPDGAQLKQIWNDFIQSPEFIKLILSNLDLILSKVIKDKNVLGWITKLISSLTK